MSKEYKKVHALMRRGPEWNDLVDVYGVKGDAEAEARKRNALITRMKHEGIGDDLERLSHYEVVPKVIK